jgi:hypothetical protein
MSVIYLYFLRLIFYDCGLLLQGVLEFLVALQQRLSQLRRQLKICIKKQVKI